MGMCGCIEGEASNWFIYMYDRRAACDGDVCVTNGSVLSVYSKCCDNGSACVEWEVLVCVEDSALSCWRNKDGSWGTLISIWSDWYTEGATSGEVSHWLVDNEDRSDDVRDEVVSETVLAWGATEAGRGGRWWMYLFSISLASLFSLTALRALTMSCHVRGDSCLSLSEMISRNWSSHLL